MKRLFFFIFLFSACVSYPVEKIEDNTPQKNPQLPTFQATEMLFNAHLFDGHYKSELKNIKITVLYIDTPATLEPIDYKTFEFRSYTKNTGAIIFNNSFYWQSIPITIERNGSFKQTVGPKAIFFFGYYWGEKLEIEGYLQNKNITAKIKRTIYTGNTSTSLVAIAIFNYSLKGSKRYKQLSSIPSSISGEYKTNAVLINGTCNPAIIPATPFITTIIPQSLNTAYMKLGDYLPLETVPFNTDGNIDTTATEGINLFTLRGKITPSILSLDLTVQYSQFKCTENYRVVGTKRFEEANDDEKNIDGLYDTWLTRNKNNCGLEIGSKRSFYEVYSFSDTKAKLFLGTLEFNFDIKNTAFTTTTYDNWYHATYTITGTITPNQLIAEMSVRSDYDDCVVKYDLVGNKLYKHN